MRSRDLLLSGADYDWITNYATKWITGHEISWTETRQTWKLTTKKVNKKGEEIGEN